MNAIEAHRNLLRNDHSPIPSIDFGAGSQGPNRRVSDIARKALKRPKHAKALAALCEHLQANHVLELGTSLGITTAHMAATGATIQTLEGNPHIAKRAAAIWQQLNLDHIDIHIGSFDETLREQIPLWIENQLAFDLIFIDGNHRGAAMIQYINLLKPMLKPTGVIVCDDIHWSKDMESAWGHLVHSPEWKVKLDFYEWGLLSNHPDLSKEFKCILF